LYVKVTDFFLNKIVSFVENI